MCSLVQKACRSQFGLDHDFHRIRCEEDFRRLVPLREPIRLWREYGVPNLPSLDDCLWPGSVSYVATFDSPVQQGQAPILVTDALSAAYRDAFLTALALIAQARPRAEIFSGATLLVGGDMALTPVQGRAGPDTLESWTRRQVPWWLRPFTILSPQSGETTLEELTEHLADQSVTCLVGSPSRLRALWNCLREKKAGDCFRDVWPELIAVICTRSTTSPLDEPVAPLIDREGYAPTVLVLDALTHPLGVLALEDPFKKQLRPLADQSAYWELIPLDELESRHPRRLGIADTEAGVPYALALTSPAGYWACLVGLTVCFDSVEPPLLRSVEVQRPHVSTSSVLPLRGDTANPLPAPVGHRQSAGSPEGRPRKLSRSPW